jgi:hypothetical protein
LGHTVVAASERKDLKQLPKHHNLESNIDKRRTVKNGRTPIAHAHFDSCLALGD